MVIGGLIGGYFGADIALKFDSEKMRRAIIIYAFVLTAYFFAEQFVI